MLLNRTYEYELPTKIVFGVGALDNISLIATKMQKKKALLVSDPGLKIAGILDKVAHKLADKTGIEVETFTEIEREPDVSCIAVGTKKAIDWNADLIVGVGGGSALDAAKAIAVMAKNKGKIEDYAGLDKVPRKGLPCFCIPTTAGTGSEITIWSVLSKKNDNLKLPVGSKYLAPDIAICDPLLTLNLPPEITAATGADALAHALESFVNKATQPISEALSRESMRLIAKSLRKAVHHGEDLEARSDMLLASAIAAMAFNPTRLGVSHALSMPLGGRFKIHHGLLNGILLPKAMAYNLPGNLEKFKEIAEIFGARTEGMSLREAAEMSVWQIEKLNADIGITAGLRDLGVTEADFDAICEEGMTSGNVPLNPRRLTVDDMRAILRQCL